MSVRVLLVAPAGALLIGAAVAQSAPTGVPARSTATPTAHAASPKPYTAQFSYDETNPGHQRGAVTVGIQGHGTFSAQLSARGALAAAIISLATGVPVSKIARGGTYVLQRQIAGNGDVSGLAVAKFKAHGLGTACLSYTVKPGKFVPSMSFVPMSGTIRTVGGTRAAATWQAKVSFNQDSLTGNKVESFGASGSERASTGKADPMSATCKQVAKVPVSPKRG